MKASLTFEKNDEIKIRAEVPMGPTVILNIDDSGQLTVKAVLVTGEVAAEFTMAQDGTIEYGPAKFVGHTSKGRAEARAN